MKKKQKPSLNGGNGRDARGKFAPGNKGGPGNPLAKHVNRIRAKLLTSITTEDLEQIIAKLIELAKAGDMAAIREVLDRCIGRNISFVQLREVEREVEWKRRYRMPWEPNDDE